MPYEKADPETGCALIAIVIGVGTAAFWGAVLWLFGWLWALTLLIIFALLVGLIVVTSRTTE